MKEWTDRLGAERGFLRSLFQPAAAARPAFDALVTLVAGRGPLPARAAAAFGRLLVTYWGFAFWSLAALAAYVAAVEETGAASLGVLVASSVVLGVLVTLAVLALTLGAAAWNLQRALEANGFGMCPGVRQAAGSGPALGEWMHGAIQACAGRTATDAPLTFADLAARGINLRTITTDLSHARPVDLPVPEDFPTDYLFDPADLRERVPPEILAHLERVAEPVEVTMWGGKRRQLRRLPRADMPVLLATRLSLTFPILLSTIRFWSVPPDSEHPIEHCFSDGGISSNFPIHFFDGWVPRRATFGLDLQTRQGEKETEVLLVGSKKTDPPPPPRYGRVRSVGDFAKQIADAARNWHDVTQSELPGFRDRVCHIRLSKDEGGLNLDMDEETIRTLMKRGIEAGRQIATKFDWDVHRFARYLTLMQMLQRSLRGSRLGFDGFSGVLSSGGLPARSGYTAGHEGTWCVDAARETEELIEEAEGWAVAAAPRGGFDQGSGVEPVPAPTLRVVPDV
jgi:hypothetical protein